MTDKIEALRTLIKHVNQKAKDLNLQVADLAFRPATDSEGRDVMSIVFVLTAEAVESAEETVQRKTDDEFEALFAANFGDTVEFADDETKELVEKQKQKELNAKDVLADMLGEFDEDDDE